MFISENDVVLKPKLVDFVYEGIINWIRHKLIFDLNGLPTLYNCPFYNIKHDGLDPQGNDNHVVLMKKILNSGYLDGKTILVLNDKMYSSSVIHYNESCNKWKYDGEYLFTSGNSEGIENNAMAKYIVEEDGSNLYFDMCCIRSMEKLEIDWSRYINFIDMIEPFLIIGWGSYACSDMYYNNVKESSLIDSLFMYKLHDMYLSYNGGEHMPLFLSLLRGFS